MWTSYVCGPIQYVVFGVWLSVCGVSGGPAMCGLQLCVGRLHVGCKHVCGPAKVKTWIFTGIFSFIIYEDGW